MKNYKLIATAAFGLEAVVAKEVKQMGFSQIETENGRVVYQSDERGICRSNLWLRSADRVFIRLGVFKAMTFTELFDQVKAIDWAELLPQDARFIVNAKSVKSTLYSLSDIQSITKKAIVEQLKSVYKLEWMPETGATYPILINILKDRVEVLLDTSGDGLHKRGYREKANEAPIKETLASALVQLSGWQPGLPLCDPLCGTGTVLIEAAMIARRIAPGLLRKFISETWTFIPSEIWKSERAAAYQCIDHQKELHIYGSDIQESVIELAKENADKAGVLEDIHFEEKSVEFLRLKDEGGIIISNPPYGERLGEEKEVLALYKMMGQAFRNNPTWQVNVITSAEFFEKSYGAPATKNRKLYNGRIKCYFYQYDAISKSSR